MQTRGFTLVELVVAILLVGILAFTAIPRFFGRLSFETRGFADQAQAALRYAQKEAIAQRRNVCVSIAGGTLNFTQAAAAGTGAGCTLPLPGPTGEAAFSVSAPGGVAITTTPVTGSFTYNALGGANLAGRLQVTVTGDVARNFFVEAGTGYVHE